MSRRVVFTLAALLVLAAAACKDEPGSNEELAKRKANAPPPVQRENVRVVASAVPPGKHIPCTQIVDAAAVSAAIGQPVEVREDKMFDADAVASCALHTTGKA